MKTSQIYSLAMTGMMAISLTGSGAWAAPVTGPWTNAVGFPASGAGPITGADTSSPTVGDGTPQSAVQEMFHSPFPEIALTNDGDKLVFSGSVQLIGTVNSGAETGTPRTQFRFGIFKDDGNGDDLGWVGYLMQNAHGMGNPAGAISRKNVGNTVAYLQTAGVGNATSLIATQGDGSVFNDDTFALSMTIERLGEDLMLTSSIVGTEATNFSQMLSVTDASVATLGTYSFDRIGFLLGQNLATDQAIFTNLDVAFVPAGSAGIPGDFNNDTFVNGADLAQWVGDFGVGGGSDADNDGDSDGEDFLIWQRNFGQGPAAAVSSVPEPASAVLAGALLAIVAATRRRR